MTRWCVQFWDGLPDNGRWDELAGTTCPTKAEAVVLAQALNRHTDHAERTGTFAGHRFRVRHMRRN